MKQAFGGAANNFGDRISGRLCTAYKPYFYPCNPSLEVSHNDSDVLSQLTYHKEPNNASPLNPDASNLWDKPEGWCIESDACELLTEASLCAEFKVQLLKHYRPISDDGSA